MALDPCTLTPIGVVRTVLTERAQVPRQASAPGALEARIELEPGRGFEDALGGLDAWEYVWVLFVFHRNLEQGRGWRPVVQPPRADHRVGVFATRSPHRPNPIGLSAARIVRVEGRVVHVANLDVLDGTPVLDLKPYVAYADALPGARSGWLAPEDPRPSWRVEFGPEALAQLAWLAERGVELRAGLEAALSLGPQPHAYRRIRPHAGGLRIAMKEWRADFAVDGRQVLVTAIRSGYRPRQLHTDAALGLHRDFVARFGQG